MKNRKEMNEEQLEQVNGGIVIMPDIVENNLMYKKGQTDNPAFLGNAAGARKATNLSATIANATANKGKEVTSIPVGHPDYGTNLV